MKIKVLNQILCGLFIVVSCIGASQSVSAAVGPQIYSDGEISWYLDVSSLTIQQDDDTGHAFAENLVETAANQEDDVLCVQTIRFSQAVNRTAFTQACMSYDGEKWTAFDVSSGDPVVVNAFQTGWPLAFGCSWS